MQSVVFHDSHALAKGHFSVTVFYMWPFLIAVSFVMVISEYILTRKTQEMENYVLFSLYRKETNSNALQNVSSSWASYEIT